MSIDDQEFDKAYDYLMENAAPSSAMPDTADVDVIRGTDIILGAAWRHKNGTPPEKNRLFDMQEFLSSMQAILETSEELKSDHENFRHCRRFTKMLAKVYRGLIERCIEIKPFPEPPTPEEQQVRFASLLREERNLLCEKKPDDRILSEISQIIQFNGTIHVNTHGRIVPVKVMVEKSDRKLTCIARSNLYIKNETGEIVWAESCSQPTSLAALEELSNSVVDVLVKLPKNDGHRYYELNDEL